MGWYSPLVRDLKRDLCKKRGGRRRDSQNNKKRDVLRCDNEELVEMERLDNGQHFNEHFFE